MNWLVYMNNSDITVSSNHTVNLDLIKQSISNIPTNDYAVIYCPYCYNASYSTPFLHALSHTSAALANPFLTSLAIFCISKHFCTIAYFM